MPPDVDQFLGQVRVAYAPDPDAKARVRRALVATAVLSSAAVASHTAAAKVGLGVKVGGLGLVLGGLASVSIAVGALSLSGWTPPLWEPVTVAVGVQLDSVTSAGAAARHALGTSIEASDPVVAPVAMEVEAASDDSESATRSQMVAAKEASTGALLEELRLIRTATQALRDGRSAAARDALGEHRTRFPAGKLAIERRGLTVLLQCSAGKSEGAKRAAEAFLKAAPSSPLAARVREDCVE